MSIALPASIADLLIISLSSTGLCRRSRPPRSEYQYHLFWTGWSCGDGTGKGKRGETAGTSPFMKTKTCFNLLKEKRMSFQQRPGNGHWKGLLWSTFLDYMMAIHGLFISWLRCSWVHPWGSLAQWTLGHLCLWPGNFRRLESGMIVTLGHSDVRHIDSPLVILQGFDLLKILSILLPLPKIYIIYPNPN